MDSIRYYDAAVGQSRTDESGVPDRAGPGGTALPRTSDWRVVLSLFSPSPAWHLRPFALASLLLIGFVVWDAPKGAAQSPATAPAYVGSQGCADCHKAAAAAWKDSHHALAWSEPTEATVLGDFDDATFVHQGVTHRFLRKGKTFFIERRDTGTIERYRVVGVAGIAPLQQYIVETEPGRYQAHDVVWDVAGKRWYHLYPDQDLKPGNGLHWTGPYKTWNARCAECHATGYEKAYDPVKRTYHSRQAEIGVGCEACHGPGSAHVDWAGGKPVPGEAGLSPAGLIVDFDSASPRTEIQQCAGCHSRREPIGADSPTPGTNFHDAYRLALLRQGLYHADGSIEDEVYVYGSFLQSKMYAKGVRCTDCHDPHAPQDIARGNGICTQCHSETGNARFPSLRRAAYDTAEHHFHAPGSEGASCRSCHMIERIYMGIDGRRDHSFRVPRPDLSAETGAPDACTDCHTDRDTAWAAREVAARFPASDHRNPHFGQVFARAWTDPTAATEDLFAIAESPETAGIVRATALDLLRLEASPGTADRAAALLSDADPLVRSAAVALQVQAAPTDRVQRVLPLLEDNLRTVRIAAARAMLGAPIARLPRRYQTTLDAASRELQASLRAKFDFPESQMVIAGTALTVRNFNVAEAAFREAVRMDPQLADAWAMIVRIRDALGDPKGARAALNEAKTFNPDDLRLFELDLAIPK